MSYAYAPDERLGRAPPQLYQTNEYQINEPPRQPRANTPERIRERQVKDVRPPYAHTPRDDIFYMRDPTDGRMKPNPELLKDHLLNEGRLTEEQTIFILEAVTEVMSREPNMLNLTGPITVCGDIHGQFYDLMKAFEIGGKFTETNYLFLGDYVDRGCFGIECLLYLYALKLWYPSALALLRGNHECRHLTGFFTFRRECLHKYSERVYEACVRSFDSLPLTALIDGKFFAVHGGISPHLDRISELNQIDRFMEPPSSGLLCDLLWADPFLDYGNENLPPVAYDPADPRARGFYPNQVRGCSYNYSYGAVCAFLERNGLLGIFRGHEVQDAGYLMYRKTSTKKFPSVITVFSAPNYLDVYHNKGAVIKYKNKNITIRQFNASLHPYWLPNFMDGFTWSLPFVGSKITEMLLAVLSVCTQEELSDTSSDYASEYYDPQAEEDEEEEARELRKEEIRNKILAVGKMQRVFQLLREEAESATELMTTTPPPPMPMGLPGLVPASSYSPEHSPSPPSEPADGSVPPGAWPGGFVSGLPDALGVQFNTVRRQIRSFSDARTADRANERLPHFAAPGAPLVPAPSMRLPRLESYSQSGEHDGDEGMEGVPHAPMESLIRRALEEEGVDDGGMVERIAERIARGRPPRRPQGLKRFETAP